MINTRQLTRDRAGKYFFLLKKLDKEISLTGLFKKLGLKPHKDWVYDTYVLEDPELFYQVEELTDFIFQKLVDVLRENDHLISSDDDTEDDKIKLDNISKAKRLLHAIRLSNLMKITPNYLNPHDHIFPKIQERDILNTSLRWIYSFRSFLHKEHAWDLLLIISEKGRFLNQNIKGIEGKVMEIILASFDSNDYPPLSRDQEDRLKSLTTLSNKLLYLPWWLHNKHLALFLKRKDNSSLRQQKHTWQSKWELKEGYYYESRLLARRINPVRLKAQDDLVILLETFANYWYRSQAYKLGESIPIIQDRKTLDEQIEKLLDLYEKVSHKRG